ncbi:nicotinate-nucleotide--dimethylbenzimidazole phosphoribosyltransferase [Sphingomonas koreensis]|jgi:nicotinate-nucleotide--dimethylbenzimidazole phosphoribosyltransferase|uniref:Nicotinate-nucleotide--dimethylbenzimidazole phosphoribosyltransferase n=1 Tax=Sphingomonas koreensis TaxID=93064 RepID=A0A1L6JAR2_9SPHN|nr:nicotinate-nucleotide--dimethylbenzimidazole phosphoribosyltransferase [Sphingomonas koreensis]APR53003.1 nicotinate-nucleotide--dimethylbenzimidazole phosphoribosyltransferase [Sphingomonas koreensis]MDC7811365.1 nicotinate-nucleotide--dimethylbenzimidazole phosphoribosyltransferase [Sphingomonas koreensis]RSU18196.1 nicotinate-nucleotide--dimethylbenzimidazole phosphoribosyltransferase [Sphingomonas koreensis]RSU23506.1 nicotinate-nucleotide--dimethylbenzimidazole phosphoribosyltransferase
MRFDSPQAFAARLADLPGPDAGAREAAAARQAQLTKPAGSLGRLEEIALFMAGWQGKERPALDRVRTAIFAGNHGVTRHGISAFPADVTVQMVANFEAGGAAINQLARAAGLELRVIALDLDRPTADFTEAPAMSADECLAALNRGAELVEPGLDLLTVGEMGIGNSTAAAALCARSLGGDVRDWVGPGTGLDSAGIARKVAVTEQALAKHADAPRTAFETLRRLGGREIAAIAGAVLAARHARVPVMLDGFIACAALAPLVADQPALAEHCLAGHCSAEPGHRRLLHQFSLTPLLQLGMRLGEGSGAAVAVPIVRAALATHNGMATFAEASVSGKL